MSFAYCVMEPNEYEDAISGTNLNQAIDDGVFPLTFIATFGLRDPLRNRVQSCVKYARDQAHIEVRLVSGDHPETAKAVAIKTDILRPEEWGETNACMTGQEFDDCVGNQITVEYNESGEPDI